jgi:hypothetical protein
VDTPKWAPGAVAAASRQGSLSASDLFSGKAWDELLKGLGRAAQAVKELTPDSEETDLVSGYRHLLVLLALGIDECVRRDPGSPRLRPGNVDNVLKWGMDCPDAAYLGAPVRGGAGYRVRGSRGSVRYLGFQIMSGMTTTANVVADDLDIAPDGTFELLLSSEPRPGNWMPVAAGASSLVVRQFFYDWLEEEPARLVIEQMEGESSQHEPGEHELDPEQLANQLAVLGEFVEASVEFWGEMDKMLSDNGANTFRPPANRTDIGGAEENVTVWGSWRLGEGEALVIEVSPPECLYWSVALGNRWWESIDYANHQSSLNGHQAVVDADGQFRAVVCLRDPGVANWLDPAGHRSGPVIFRWLRAATDPPVPTITVVRLDELNEALPMTTARVTESDRARIVEARRAGVARRFVR